MKPVSVILVRENAEQLTGSGCCGKLEGDNACLGGERIFAQSDQEKARMGVLYRAVREAFPDGRVELVQVDPRNQLYLTAKLVRDAVRYRPGVLAAIKLAFQAFAMPAVVLNGRVLSRRGTLPSPDDLLGEIEASLTSARSVVAPDS